MRHQARHSFERDPNIGRRGSVLIYSIVTFTLLLALASLGVDWGRVQVTREELQRCADATALGTMDAYAQSGYSAAAAAAPVIMASNPVDVGSHITPALALTGGTWDDTAHTFSSTYAPGTSAVMVKVSRTKANGNPLNLFFAGLAGFRTWDVSATAIATLINSATGSTSVPATGNTYFAGMPSGTTNAWGDTTSNASPSQMVCVPVTPGTWITVTNVSGQTCILPGYTGNFGPDGEATRKLHHNQNYDGSDWGIGPANGIADAVLPADALTGLFLDDNAPNTTAAPTGVVDWTDPTVQNQTTITDLTIKQPFMIGDGKNTSGTVQQFLVPTKATRMFLTIWDGTASSNNSGSLSATISSSQKVMLVK